MTGARMHLEAAQRGGFRVHVVMVTLTYAPGRVAQACHVSEAIKRARHWLARRGKVARYVWVREFTQAGVPHYHLLFVLPRDCRLPKFDNRGWWPYGSTRMERCRAAIGYVAKYASKGSACERLASGARCFGVGGLQGVARCEQRFWRAPRYVRDEIEFPGDVRRAAGGGYVDRATGELFRSPWVFFNPRDGSSLRLIPREQYGWVLRVLDEAAADGVYKPGLL